MEEKAETLKQIFSFLFITSLISTGIFIWMFSGAKDSPAAVLSMMFTPGISAVITAIFFKDRIGDFGWKVKQARFLAYSYLLPLLVSLIAYGIVWMTQYADFTTERVIHYKWAKILGFDLPAPFLAGLFSKMLLASLLALIPVFGEEVGWSGFLTPKLRKVFSIPVTSVWVGVYWAVWHFPAIIGGFYGSGAPLQVALPGFTLVLIGASFLRTVLIERSKSLWVGVFLHASHNVILMGMFWEMTVHNEHAKYLVSETGVFLGFVYILAAIGFWKFRLKKTAIRDYRTHPEYKMKYKKPQA